MKKDNKPKVLDLSKSFIPVATIPNEEFTSKITNSKPIKKEAKK